MPLNKKGKKIKKSMVKQYGKKKGEVYFLCYGKFWKIKRCQKKEKYQK